MSQRTCADRISSTQFRRLMSQRAHPLANLDALASVSQYRRGQEICGDGRLADRWYYVVQGAARRCIARRDGRRQIVDLLLPGNFFGFTLGDTYDFAVEAVSRGTVVAIYPRRRVEALADSDPSLARELREVAFAAMSRLQEQLLIMGRTTALEKVGSFILDMEARLPDSRGDNVVLPVSRYDIADYLGVSVETVSRSLTHLKHRGVIALSGTRTVRIIDRDQCG
jgi:CRP/FNR family nitrogen fixation transcriptional regulator